VLCWRAGEEPQPNRSALIVTSDPSSSDERGRVLRFRPRGSPPRPAWRWPDADSEQNTPVEDLSKYERTETPDDYRHRMMMNLLTLAVALVLIGCGLWLTSKIVENRNLQDCFLTGRRNCAPILLPPRAGPQAPQDTHARHEVPGIAALLERA
jgi:hypothetical protein